MRAEEEEGRRKMGRESDKVKSEMESNDKDYKKKILEGKGGERKRKEN